MLSRDLVTNSL